SPVFVGVVSGPLDGLFHTRAGCGPATRAGAEAAAAAPALLLRQLTTPIPAARIEPASPQLLYPGRHVQVAQRRRQETGGLLQEGDVAVRERDSGSGQAGDVADQGADQIVWVVVGHRSCLL